MEFVKFKLHDGKEIELHCEDVERIARHHFRSYDYWCDKAEKYAEEMHDKSRENLRNAFCLEFKPKTEDQVKDEIAHAIRRAVSTGDWVTFAEVLYEAMEFETSSFVHGMMESNMNLQDLIMPFIMNNPSTKAKIEAIFKQPADHVIKSFNTFIDTVNNGPGLVNKAAEQQAVFDRFYQGGLALGFTDWESEIAAASLSGYSLMDVCISFRKNRGWKDTTVEKLKVLSDNVAERFIPKAKAAGLIPEEPEEPGGMPKVERTTVGGAPPWATSETSANSDADSNQAQ